MVSNHLLYIGHRKIYAREEVLGYHKGKLMEGKREKGNEAEGMKEKSGRSSVEEVH